ncbi:MAG: lysophospholipid acyltransferase family protein [Pirellulales bacterium]|nr:lysophospholipid acyltransferase family protein [Pirellulales bacterium]
MKLPKTLVNNLGGLLVSTAVRHWMGTLEYKCAYYDESIDPVKPTYAGQKIYIFWHEYLLFPLYLRGNCNLTMLVSQHHDADMLTRTAYYMGFEFARGSSYRGGLSGLRELFRRSRDMNLTITPDGPRGPRRVLAQGPIYLASKLNLPLVAMGFGYDRPWRLNTWDHHALPRPFSRARAVVSPEIHVPNNLTRDGIEHYRLEVERLLNRLTLEAEAWAESGTRKIDEAPLRREPLWSTRTQLEKAHAKPAPHFIRQRIGARISE